MCGRYTLAQGEKIIEAIPNVTIREDLHVLGRWNIAPTQDILAVANISSAGRPPLDLQFMRWGLIPAWAKDPSIGTRMINARAETLAQKPVFRTALQRRRCAIPADGFYEWRQNPDGTKTPLYIRLKSHRGFAFAGLWDIWETPTAILLTCTIITTTPNALLAPIHHRMPVILSPETLPDWLDLHPRDPHEMLSRLKPYPADDMEMHPVSPQVNTATHDTPDLITPVEDTPPPSPQRKQGTPEKSKKHKPPNSNQGTLF